MGPTVMGNLMARLHDGLALVRIGFDGEARREPGRTNPPRLQKRQNTRRRPRSELAARQGSRRGEAARDEARHGVEIEGEANDVTRHGVSLRLKGLSGRQFGRRLFANLGPAVQAIKSFGACPRRSSALQSHGRCREGFDRPSAAKRVRCRALRKKGARKARRSFHPADPLPRNLGSRRLLPRPKMWSCRKSNWRPIRLTRVLTGDFPEPTTESRRCVDGQRAWPCVSYHGVKYPATNVASRARLDEVDPPFARHPQAAPPGPPSTRADDSGK